MEFYTNTVAAEFFDNGIAMLMCQLRNSSADIAQKTPRLSCFNTAQQTLLGDCNQICRRLSNLANHKHTGCVSIIAIVDSRNVYVHNVTAAQHVMLAGNAVANLVIDRGTHALREAFIAQRCRDSVMRYCIFVNDSVDISSSHTGFNIFGNLIQYTGIDFASCTNTCNLLRGFNHIAVRNLAALSLQQRNFCIIHFVAICICFTAATPT